MSSVRRRVKHTVPAVRKPEPVPPSASHQPQKGLAVSSILILLVALLLVWKFAPANSAHAAPALLTSRTDAPMPDAVKDNLSPSVPAQMEEDGAKMRRVVDKKIANGMVTLVLKDEQTGQLSVMKQPLGTNVSTVEEGGKEQVAAAAPAAKPLDPARDDLTTTGIEKIKAGMTVPTRNPVTGKTEFKKVTRTFKRTAYEIIKLKLADGKTGKIVDSLRGTPEHPFFTPSGMVAMGALKPEMKVITWRGPPLIVKSVTREPHPEGIAVYNFEVEGDHTYFVGKAEGGVWAHNTCPLWITPGSLAAEEEAAVVDGLNHLKAGTRPSYGRKWGDVFQNRGNPLPTADTAGNPITYTEHYLQKAPIDPSRWGPRRLVVGSDGNVYYTWDHYGNFVRVR